MTTPRADPEPARGLRLAWFGHAVGARADGLTTYSAEVVGGLVARGAEVWFHHAERDGEQTPVDGPHQVAWPTFRFKTVTLARSGFRRDLRRWLGRVRPDVVHVSLSFTLQDGWLGAEARNRGAATVATFHLPFGSPGSARALVMRRLHRFWAPRLRPYQRVIVFSEEHRRRLAGVGVAQDRIAVVPNAVDVEVFTPGPSRLRERHLAGAQFVVGYLGRLDPEKGLPELLRGFQGADLGSGARLVLAGRGALEAEVERAQRDPRVIYLGQLVTLADRVDFWRGVDLFCLPSSAEGLSIALLEAMASGCAVAATPAGGASLVGGAARILTPGDLAGSLAQTIGELAQRPDERERQGQASREEAVRHHGLSAMLERLLEIYRDCRGPSSR
ncbi:MAG TPA: glycosyltransferase family 4 protein [Candidatus Dormibacteraeota bacterium]